MTKKTSLLHWKVDSLPLSHQGSPALTLSFIKYRIFPSKVLTINRPAWHLLAYCFSPQPRLTLGLKLYKGKFWSVASTATFQLVQSWRCVTSTVTACLQHCHASSPAKPTSNFSGFLFWKMRAELKGLQGLFHRGIPWFWVLPSGTHSLHVESEK